MYDWVQMFRCEIINGSFQKISVGSQEIIGFSSKVCGISKFVFN
jgi:hypothetical protein